MNLYYLLKVTLLMKLLLICISLILLTQANDTYILKIKNKTHFVSKRVYNGQEVIVIENNNTYIPFSMFGDKVKDKPKKIEKD